MKITEKLPVMIFGLGLTTIISIIFAIVLDCKIYGEYIVFFDIGTSLTWILVANYIVNSHKRTLRELEEKFGNKSNFYLNKK